MCFVAVTLIYHAFVDIIRQEEIKRFPDMTDPGRPEWENDQRGVSDATRVSPEWGDD